MDQRHAGPPFRVMGDFVQPPMRGNTLVHVEFTLALSLEAIEAARHYVESQRSDFRAVPDADLVAYLAGQTMLTALVVITEQHAGRPVKLSDD